MTCTFSGMLFNNRYDLAKAIAGQFFGQHSTREILTAFAESDSSAMAAEAIDGWDLDREEYMINGDLTADMIAQALDNLHATTVRETIAEIDPEDVMMWANCSETERGEDGNWWIAGPQTGHWLKPHEQAGLALWAVTQ